MKKSLLLGAIATIAMSIPTVAHAGGPPVENFTITTAESATVPFSGPCTGSGWVTIDYHDTFHVTDFGDGRVVVKFNQAGTFAFDPDEPGALNSSGHYRNGDTTVSTRSTFTRTSNFIVQGRDEAGERVAFPIHTVFVVSNGDVRVDVVDTDS